jgi:hypothetical protein
LGPLFEEVRHVAEVKVVGAEVVVGVNTHDGVEATPSERKYVCFGMDRYDEVLEVGGADPLQIRRCLNP